MKQRLLWLVVCAAACGEVSDKPIDAPPDEGGSAFTVSAPATIRIVQGMSEPATIQLARTGYTGAVTITVSGLPSGVTADPLTIGAGSDTGTLVLRSESSAMLGSGAMITITGDGGGAMPTAMAQVYVQGPRGALDTTFNTTGKVTVNVGSDVNSDQAHGVAVMPNGKIILVGGGTNGTSTNFAGAVALTPEGALDTTMFNNGKHIGTYTPGANIADHFFGAAVQPDGKVIAAGYAGVLGASHFFLVARFTTLGVLDTTFGLNSTGFNGTDFDPAAGDDAKAYGVAVKPDGSILLGGFYASSAGTYATTAKYTAGGALVGRLPNGVGTDRFAVGVNPDGTVLSIGRMSGQLSITRYTAADALDTTFGGGTGSVMVALRSSGNEVPHSIAIMPDGKFYVGTFSQNGSMYEAAVARFTADGTLDTSFGGTGFVTTMTGNDLNFASGGMAQHPDGGVVLAYTKTNTNTDFAWVRVRADGTVDAPVSTDFGNGADTAGAVAVQPDGRIIVVGTGRANGRANMAAARYWP